MYSQNLDVCRCLFFLLHAIWNSGHETAVEKKKIYVQILSSLFRVFSKLSGLRERIDFPGIPIH